MLLYFYQPRKHVNVFTSANFLEILSIKGAIHLPLAMYGTLYFYLQHFQLSVKLVYVCPPLTVRNKHVPFCILK